MGKRELNVLSKQQGVVCRNVLIGQQARKSRQVVISQELRGLLSQEASGNQYIELLAAIEIEHVADTVEHFTADTATS
jgi:hypothetical protein